jgi:hypothetical protein
LSIKPLGTENNTKEGDRERKKSLSGNQANRKWISGEQGAGREIKNQISKCKKQKYNGKIKNGFLRRNDRIRDLFNSVARFFAALRMTAYQGNHIGLPLRGDDRKMVCGAHPTAGLCPWRLFRVCGGDHIGSPVRSPGVGTLDPCLIHAGIQNIRPIRMSFVIVPCAFMLYLAEKAAIFPFYSFLGEKRLANIVIAD